MPDFTQEQLDAAKASCRRAEGFLIRASQNPQQRQGIAEALEIYQDLIAREFPLIEPYIGLAYLIFSQGDLEKAIAILNFPKNMGLVDSRLDLMQSRMFKLHQTRLQRKLEQKPSKMKKVASMKSASSTAGALDLNTNLANQEITAPLEKGAEGDDIIRLQIFLKQQGLFRGEPHGRFDAATAVAVKAFQLKNQLPPSGQVDQATLTLINQRLI